MQEHFTTLRGLLDEFDIYQPLIADITKMRQYREELAVVAYLSSLNLELSSQIRGQILGAVTLLDLQSTFSRVLRISTAMPTPVTDQSAMAASSSHDRGSVGREGWGGSCCQHCGRLGHRFEKRWNKFGKSP